MINKQSMWFLTLLSLVLVLGVYYVTMPNDLLSSKITSDKVKEDVVTTKIIDNRISSLYELEKAYPKNIEIKEEK